MDKKDIAGIRKEFKNESTSLQIDDIYSVYLKPGNDEAIYQEYKHFHQMESELQEIYLGNFKKVLTGPLDTKVFELGFSNVEEGSAREILNAAVYSNRDEFIGSCEEIINRLKQNFMYENDVLISFLRAQYFKGAKRRTQKMLDSDEAIDDAVIPHKFIICAINKLEPQKKALKFDFDKKEFTTNSAIDTVVNLKAPLDGFMFPSLTDNMTDVNKVIYYGSKSNEPNTMLVENVLECSLKETADDEKNLFTGVLRTVIGEAVEPEIMQKIYAKLNEKIEEYEEGDDQDQVPAIGAKELKNILESSGAELRSSDIGSAFGEMAGDDNYEFTIENILPKSIKIQNSEATITINPKDLDHIRQVRDKQGNKCLLIRLMEDVTVEGFTLKTEEE